MSREGGANFFFFLLTCLMDGPELQFLRLTIKTKTPDKVNVYLFFGVQYNQNKCK